MITIFKIFESNTPDKGDFIYYITKGKGACSGIGQVTKVFPEANWKYFIKVIEKITPDIFNKFDENSS